MKIRGFITNLGKYNEGELIGEWIEFPIDDDELEQVFQRIGINEMYEEYFFTDWENAFDSFGEYESVNNINDIAQELESADLEIIEAIIEATDYSLVEALACVDDAIYYKNMTLVDVAYELVEECYDLPEIAQRYFDYDAFARDLRFDGYYEVSNGVICIP